MRRENIIRLLAVREPSGTVGVLGGAKRFGKGVMTSADKRGLGVGERRRRGRTSFCGQCVIHVALQEKVSLSNKMRGALRGLAQVVYKSAEDTRGLTALAKRAGLGHVEELFLSQQLISGAIFT